MNILLTDDSLFMRTLLKDILQSAYPDATYIEAANGNEAVTLVESHQPDLLLLDMIMPDKGGIEVLRDIQGSFTGKVIVVSATGQEPVVSEAKDLGAFDFIVKPFEKEQVLGVVADALS